MIKYNKIFKDEPKEIIEYNKNMIKNKLYNQDFGWKYFYNELNKYYYYFNTHYFDRFIKINEKAKIINNYIIIYNKNINKTYMDDTILNFDDYEEYINGKLFATKYFLYYIDNDTGLCYIDNIGAYQDFELFRDKQGNNIVIKEFINEIEYKGFKIMIIKDIKNNYYITETYKTLQEVIKSIIYH